MLEGLSGLVLTGGVDIYPVHYNEEPHPRTQEPDPTRDSVEFDLLREAIANDIPVFAICRGMQLANVVMGGSPGSPQPAQT